MNVDLRSITQSKDAMREKLAALPIAEKLRLLDVLRERALAIASSRPARRLTPSQ